MIGGCVNCGVKEADRKKEKAINDATEYANQQNKPIAVYKDEYGEWKYGDAFAVYAAGYSVITVLSKYNGATLT